MSLKDRLLKASTIKETDIMAESKFFNQKDHIPTTVPSINLACSGRLDGGITPGLTVIAGPSKHFKSNIMLIMARAYLERYPDAVMLFYDSEFGSPQSYFEAHGIDPARVIHVPITDIEQLKFDIVQQLEEIKRGDRVFVAIDSIGNLASKKEVEDALKQSSAADMTRAKQLKSFFRMVTPHLTIKDIPMVVVNHVYMTQEMFSKPVVSGGTGVYYSANSIWIIGRQQEKEGTEVIGYNFIINIEKSRFVKEKSKIPLMVTYSGGISKYGGLLDLALESGHIIKPKNGWYQHVDMQTGEIYPKSYRLKDLMSSADLWQQVTSCSKFADFVKNKYELPAGVMEEQEESFDEVMEALTDEGA
jgi:RecA/RadA recombinase